MRRFFSKRSKQSLVPVVLVGLVLVLAPVSSVRASAPVAKPVRSAAPSPTIQPEASNTVLLTAAVVVVAATAVATTTTDIAVATELTVLTEVAARTTGELGDPLPVSLFPDPNTARKIAREEFDH